MDESAADEEGKRRIEEIGLLRAQMRLDLDIYSTPYLPSPDEKGKELLAAAGIDPDGWGTLPWRTRAAERIRRATRHVTTQLPPHVADTNDTTAETTTGAPAAELPAAPPPLSHSR